MKKQRIAVPLTGGTIGGTRAGSDADDEIQAEIITHMHRVPFVEANAMEVRLSSGRVMADDSSSHAMQSHVELALLGVELQGQGYRGIAVSHGTDSMNLQGDIAALVGAECWKVPYVLTGCIVDPSKRHSDAQVNAFTGAYFAAYGDASGVFAVRPEGIIITSRHDTPCGSIGWHDRLAKKEFNSLHSVIFGIVAESRRSQQIARDVHDEKQHNYFARILLERLLDDGGNVKELSSGKHATPIDELKGLIRYQREIFDGTLDGRDQGVTGGRGRVPHVFMSGYGKERLDELFGSYDEDVDQFVEQLASLVEEKLEDGGAVGRTIPYFALVERVKRHRTRGSDIHKNWKRVMKRLAYKGLRMDSRLADSVADFWERHSRKPNANFDFTDIVTLEAGSDPDYLLRSFDAVPPKGVVLRATGSAGLRLKYEEDSFVPVLEHCRKREIPVLLVSSSPGEVTSLHYGPAREIFESDLAFFGGTFDYDLARPRLALLNHQENRTFQEALLATLEERAGIVDKMRRGMQRQLLSGSHYARGPSRGKSDRQLMEEKYGIETRIDLLGGVHTKKALLGAFLGQCEYRKIPIPEEVVGVLERY